ncbi:hypothetical protein [Azospirillum sp. sgz301742]
MTVPSAPAQARIVIEPTVRPATVKVAPHVGEWLPSALFLSSALPSAAAPLVCDARYNPVLRARVDRLFQQQQLSHTLARARFWRSQR